MSLTIDGTSIGMGVADDVPCLGTQDGLIRASFASMDGGSLSAAMWGQFNGSGVVSTAYVYSPGTGVVNVSSYPLPVTSKLITHPLN